MPETKLNFRQSFWSHFKRIGPLYFTCYMISGITLALAFAVGLKVGIAIDFLGIYEILETMIQIVILLGLAVLAQQFVLIVKNRSDSPSRDLFQALMDRVNDGAKLAKISHMLIIFSLMTVGFGVLKSSISVLNPFSWDVFFKDLDQAVHFGRLPHEWLSLIMQNPAFLWAFNFAYNLWFFLIFLFLYVFCSRYGDRREGIQFMNAFCLSWVVIGFFIATYFSSAGPCYFERVGLGDDYVGLMGNLDHASQSFRIWALETQNLLWDGQEGVRDGRLGISAFPSMHVAIAVVMAMGASSVSRFWGGICWMFALTIFIGSIVLGWHYAVDGYASLILMMVIWKISGWLANWSMKRVHNDLDA